MFNKPVFGRNEPVTRRDATPVLAAQPAAQPISAQRSSAERAASVTPAPPSAPSALIAQAPRETLPGEQVSGARLIVGPDVKLKGAEILDCDTLIVEGRVEATMDSRLIRIAHHGAFVGKVSIDIAEIDGSFEGELTARSQLIIRSTGRVSGTIRFGKLVVEEGGELNGDISVLNDSSVPVAKTLNAPASPRSVVEPLVALSATAA